MPAGHGRLLKTINECDQIEQIQPPTTSHQDHCQAPVDIDHGHDVPLVFVVFALSNSDSLQDIRTLQPDAHSSSVRLRFSGVVLCALLVQLVSAQSTHASCGDWLANHSESTEPAAASQHDQPGSMQRAEQKNPQREKRCQGLLCQNAPAPVTPSLPVPPTPVSQQWLQLPDGVDHVNFDSCSRALPQCDPSPESASLRRLDRPPCF